MSALGLQLDSSLGALEIGVLFSTLLFGIFTIQVYSYYSNFSSDAVATKIQVAFVWFCEFGSAISIAHALYVITVTNYGNPQSLVLVPKTLGVAQLFACFIPPIVQTYFALRIYRFSEKPYIPLISFALSLLGCVGGLIIGVIGIIWPDLARFVDEWTWLLTVDVLIRVVNDILITSSLVIYLYFRRTETGFARTARMLDKLIKLTLETGLLTAITSSALIISFLAMRHNYIWVAIYTFLSRVFANSYLATLNSRLVLRAMNNEDIILTIQSGQFSSVPLDPPPTGILQFARSANLRT